MVKVSDPRDPITPEAIAHSIRFRRVANLYPRRVAEAYELDIARAALDDDQTVAATVRAWELANGLEPLDWLAIGRKRAERDKSNEVFDRPTLEHAIARVIRRHPNAEARRRLREWAAARAIVDETAGS